MTWLSKPEARILRSVLSHLPVFPWHSTARSGVLTTTLADGVPSGPGTERGHDRQGVVHRKSTTSHSRRPGWIVPVLFVLLSSVPDSLLAQTPPVPGVSNSVTAVNTKPPPTAADLQGAAIALQRAAIRKQAENLGLWLMPLDGKPPAETAEPQGCDPLDDNLVNPLVDDAAKQQSLDPKLLRAVIGQESAFRPCAVSAKGAQGLMQLMPETAAELGVANPFDPKQSIEAGARFLKQLLEKYKGDLPQALGAYNAGPKTVDESGSVPDVEETREYVDAILAKAGLKPADTPAKR
jgi:hypothetical protein